jgi:type I restriction enzyme S subunit
MTADLRPYPAMKDSGVPWLGEVPEHWEVRRLRNAAEMRVSNVDKHTKEDEQPVRLCNYVDVYKNDRIRASMVFMQATATRDEIARFRLEAGDVLITKDSEAWNDIGVPALVEDSAADVICGYHLALLRPFPQVVLASYLFRTLQSVPTAYQFHVEANGVTRYGLSHSAIKSIWIPLPSLPEQAAIVRFLDHVERRIRRYIRAKQKLIKLLEEEKQAIIHRAVTRGLDPSVRLKPSGVEWLGDVPEHWEVVPNRALLRLEKRLVGGAWREYPLLSLTKRGVILRDMENPEGKFPTSFEIYQEVRPGDLIFCLFDIDETPRAVGLSQLPGMITGAYTRFSCDSEAVDWVHLFYVAMDNGKRLKPLYMGLRKVITKSAFLSAKMPLPPTGERAEVVKHVQESLRTADEAAALSANVRETARSPKFSVEGRLRIV